MKTPNDFWLIWRSVDPKERAAVSNRASSRPTSASTSPPLRPFAVSVVRAWFRTLRLDALSKLPPIFIVCAPRVCVSATDTCVFVVGVVVIG